MQMKNLILLSGSLALLGCGTAKLAPAPATNRAAAAADPKSRILAPYDGSYLGMGFEPSDALTSGAGKSFGYGLRVNLIYPRTPAWEAGFQINDIILSVAGLPVYSGDTEKMADDVVELISDEPAGKLIPVKVLRPRKGDSPELLTLEVRLRRREFNPGPKVIPADSIIHPEWTERPPNEIERIAGVLTRHYGIEKDQKELDRRLKEMTVQGDAFRIPEISYVLRHPYRNAEAAEALLQNITPRVHDDTFGLGQRLISTALHLLRPERSHPDKLIEHSPLKAGLKPEEHLKQLESVLAEVDALWKKAFKDLSVEDLDFMNAHSKDFLDTFKNGQNLMAAPNQEELLNRVRMADLAAKVDYESLLLASASLLRISKPSFVQALKRDFELSGMKLKQPEVASLKTPYGEIVIAGTGDDWHDEFEKRDIAVLIDLGGNDTYSNGAGASTRKLHASIVVDLDGDDTYQANTDFAQGAGFLGIGILADLAGDDTYVGQTGAQGASFAGVGLLLDASGNDVYRAHAFAQGTGFWGLAGLIDLAGNDRYESHLLSQGVGVAGGIGALIDGRGNDSYYSTGFFASDYGTPGTFNGLSQGVGFGLRGLASGGIGILYDGQGKDRFEAGDFSQGGGYYFGWGIFENDGREDDVYIGARYAQGFSAHYAVATFIEQGGNDVYKSGFGVASGLSMDLSTTWFEDRGGGDRYEAKEFSAGSSAHNSLTVFIDRGGKNSFIGDGKWGQASAQGNYYHGGTSLSLVFDGGAPRDKVTARDDYFFIFDVQGSIDKLSDARYLESLLQPIQAPAPLKK